ncbi:MAG: hypothetical protein JNL64_11320 [Blastocatellia bacterium]|nr:hypothetical protein [Blastocatellia bacterium]
MYQISRFIFKSLLFVVSVPAIVAGQTGGDTCEEATFKLDSVRNFFAKSSDESSLIVIAELAKIESNKRISEKRLTTVRAYLNSIGLSSERIVLATSIKKAKVAALSFYFGGKLINEIRIPKSGVLKVGGCDHDPTDFIARE